MIGKEMKKRLPFERGSLMALIPVLMSMCPWLWSQDSKRGFWWEREPLRIVDVVTGFNQLTERTPSQWAEAKAMQGYNSEHFEVMNLVGGLDDLGFFFPSKVAGKQNVDYLRQYLPEAKKRGIRVMIYFDVHWYTREFGEKHREWLQIRENGSPVDDVYVTGTSFCVNGPWREWVFQVLRDLCAYPIDGIFFDGPIFFPESCYCPWCQEKYRKIYGGKLPSKKERKGTAARSLLEFQANSLADFLHDSRAIIKAANPQIALYMNGGERGGNWATARLNRVLVKEQDILGSEGGFFGGKLAGAPVWKPGVTARLLESQAAGKPRVVFSAAGHKPWTFSILPEPELRLLYAGTIANGASIWFGMYPYEFDLPEMRAITEMNRFLARNGAYYQDTRSEAKVALVWSDTSANFYEGSDAQLVELDRVPRRSEVGNLDGEFSGFADALIRSHVPFDVIDDVTLEKDDLSRYEAVLLPNVACMSGKTAERLKEYVQGGGGLIATFETSRYDETGTRRDEFALSEVLGVSSPGRIVGPKRWDYMKAQGKTPLIAGLERELVPSPEYHLQVKPAGGEMLLRFTTPLKGEYDGIPKILEDPALVENRYGKGRVFYCAADLGNGIHAYHLGEFLKLAGNAVGTLSPPQVMLENAPGSVETVLRSQQNGKRLLLHLINFTGEMTRPIQQVVPLENVRVLLRLDNVPQKVFTLMRPKLLKAEKGRDGLVGFTLPAINEYEVIVIEQ